MRTAPPSLTHRSIYIRRALRQTLLYIAIITVSGITFFPIYWMLVSTLQPSEYTLNYPPPFFPQEITVSHFYQLFSERPIALWLRNSFLIATMSMLLCLAITVPGAYTLSRLRWRGRSGFGLFLLLTQMLPEILVLIPIYVAYSQLDLINKPFAVAMIDAAFAVPVCIWILKGVFDSVPLEVLDAALVDGCTELSALWRIVLPLSLPGLVAVAVVSFFAGWNEYLFASIMLTSAENMVAGVGLTTLKGLSGVQVEQWMAAGLSFSILPVVFYLTMQRYIISGLTAGAVKG